MRMRRPIAVGDVVRIVALTGAAADHLVIATARRLPLVGDVGVVVDISDRLGGVGRHHTVACRGADATPAWLGIFAAHELEVVGANADEAHA